MKMTPNKIKKFKSDPMNQLHQKSPMTFIVVIFACGLGGVTLTHDLIQLFFENLGDGFPQRYFIATGTTIGVFLGTKHRWNYVKNKEKANQKVEHISKGSNTSL
jgi:hypothetical protein